MALGNSRQTGVWGRSGGGGGGVPHSPTPHFLVPLITTPDTIMPHHHRHVTPFTPFEDDVDIFTDSPLTFRPSIAAALQREQARDPRAPLPGGRDRRECRAGVFVQRGCRRYIARKSVSPMRRGLVVTQPVCAARACNHAPSPTNDLSARRTDSNRRYR